MKTVITILLLILPILLKSQSDTTDVKYIHGTYIYLDELLQEYATECYNDSVFECNWRFVETQDYGTYSVGYDGYECKWVHMKPTFDDFIKWLHKKLYP